jgi:hypothetical protein
MRMTIIIKIKINDNNKSYFQTLLFCYDVSPYLYEVRRAREKRRRTRERVRWMG